MKHLRAVCLYLITMIAGALQLTAQCSMSLDAAYDAPNNNLVVTVTLGARTCGAPGVSVVVDGYGGSRGTSCPTGDGCTLTFAYDTSCFAPGPHSVTATSPCRVLNGSSCDSRPPVVQSTSFTVPDRTPHASISVEETSATSILVRMPYVFFNSTGTKGLTMLHYLPNGSTDGFIYGTGATSLTGEWQEAFTDTACWLPGVHRFVLTATACNQYSTTVETSYTVPDDKPTLSNTIVNTGANSIRVDMTWGFLPSHAYHGTHSLSLHHVRPDGTEDGVYWIPTNPPFPTDSATGTWYQSFDTTCWPSGAHVFKAFASVCGDRTVTETDQTLNVDHTPHLNLSVQAPTGTAPKKAILDWSFPPGDNPAARSLTLEFLPEFPETTPTTLALPPSLDLAAGTPNPISVDVPDFGTKGILRARASNSCESVTKWVHIDCDCEPNEGPKATPNPVRLWDGSMTYSERDPLPSDGLPLFVRGYDTLNTADGVFGVGWHSVFDAGLRHFMDGAVDTVTIRTEGERRAAFTRVGSAWVQSWPTGIGAAATLTSDANGWRYRDARSTLVRLYRADGRFSGFEDVASSKKALIDYDTSGHPTRAYAADGTWSCSITMAGNHVASISVDGTTITWQYTYSGTQLLSVGLAGTSAAWRTYTYAAGLLSAVTDAAGAQIESHTYDAQHRATNSVGGGSTDITSITYGDPGSLPDSTLTKVTYATGEVTSYEQRYIQGRQQTISVVGGCGSCGSRNSTYAVDDQTGRIMRTQDARGYINSFSYDASGRLVREQHNDRPATCDPEQDMTHCRMSTAALLSAALQSTSASTFTAYGYADPFWPDKPTTISQPSVLQSGDTRVDTLTYDVATGIPLTRTSSGWTVDASGQRVRVTRTTTVALYDGTAVAAFDPGRNFSSSWLTLPQPAGRTKSIDGPRTDVSDVTQFVYYPIDTSVPATSRGRLAAVRNALGHLTTYESYDVFGNAGRVVDGNGVATDFTFDALGRPLTTTLRAFCADPANQQCGTDDVTTNSYAPSTGPLTSGTDPRGNVTAYEYDGRQRLAAMSRGPSSTSLPERIEYTYDAATGRKSMERILSCPTLGQCVEKRRESFAYDDLAQLTTSTHADSTTIGYSYDDAGSLASIRDENHGAANTHYSYDPARRLSSVRQTLGSAEITTGYTYDVAGDLATVTDPNGNATTYTYDDFGRMVSQASPVTGTTTYTYDVAGNLLSSTDANHATTANTYDALGRVLTKVSSATGAATETVTYGYDSGTLAIGRLSSMTDPAGTSNYAYERRDLLLSETRTSGSVILTTGFAYDANGNRTKLIYPSGLTLNYTYDFANRPAGLTSGVTNAVANATYLPFGPLVSYALGNGTSEARTYDARYRIQRNTLNGPSGAAIADYTYTEDAAGNITSIHDAIDPTYNRDFGYDDLNRLTVANTGSSLWGTGSYRYDAMGNLLARDIGGVVEVDPNNPLLTRKRKTLTARPDSLPAPGSIHETYSYAGTTARLATVTSDGLDHPLSYDAAGNELRYFDDRTYSARNLMSSIAEPSEDGKPHVVSYGYDGRGVRLTRSEGTSGYATAFSTRYYVYSPELQLLAVTADDNPNLWGKTAITHSLPSMKHEIAWFAGRPIGELVDGGTIRYTFSDHLGTPILQTDTSASVTWRAEYEPYGDMYVLRNGSGAAEQPLRFPGQEYERKWEGSEERYNIFRWYSAGMGRYTQPDPLGVGVSDSNLYAYVTDNPLVFLDPTGEVKVRHTFTRRGDSGFGNGGVTSFAFAKVKASGQCVGCGTRWHIELSVDIDHGYYCRYGNDCRIERWHANINSAFVSRVAQEWHEYETKEYSDKSTCEALAYFYAADLEKNLLNGAAWPKKVLRDWWQSQQDYEETHHGLCGFLGGLCGAY